MGLVLDPLADVAVTADALPDAVPVLDPIDPLSVVGVSADPRVQALTRDTAILIVAQVLVAVAEAFVALTMALVFLPLAFVDTSDLIDADTLTMTLPIVQLTTIERLLVTFDGEGTSRLELLKIKQVSYHFVLHVGLLLLQGQRFVRVSTLLLLLSVRPDV